MQVCIFCQKKIIPIQQRGLSWWLVGQDTFILLFVFTFLFVDIKCRSGYCTHTNGFSPAGKNYFCSSVVRSIPSNPRATADQFLKNSLQTCRGPLSTNIWHCSPRYGYPLRTFLELTFDGVLGISLLEFIQGIFFISIKEINQAYPNW